MSKEVKTPLGCFAFTGDLFTAREQVDGGKKKFGCTILFPKTTDIKVLKDAAVAAMTEKWGDKAVQMFKDKLIRSPFLDGDGPEGMNKKSGERLQGFAGCTFIRVNSGEDYPPVVVGPDRKHLGGPAEFYSGVWGYAVVNAYAWEHPKNGRGVSFSISAAQKAKDGERLGGGGGVDVNSAFDVIEDSGDMPASSGGAADLFD